MNRLAVVCVATLNFGCLPARAQLPKLEPPEYRIEPFTVEHIRGYADQGVDLLSNEGPGHRWMYRAVHDLRIDVMEFLLERGRKANDLLLFDRTALWYVAYHSRRANGDPVNAADLLLRYGANIDFAETRWSEDTILHAVAPHGSSELAAYLIRRGADMEAQNVRGQTPLMKACEDLRRPSNPDDTERGRKRRAARDSLIRTMVEAGCDPLRPGQRSATPLHIIAFVGRTDLADVVFRAKKYADLVTVDGQTPLHVATLTRTNSEMVRLLLKAGADPNLLDVSNERPLDIAERKNFTELVQILRPVTGSFANSDFAAVKMLDTLHDL
ncbi:MAG: ankyrin repeat domain-containing protein [Fimbriimonadales bacterium]